MGAGQISVRRALRRREGHFEGSQPERAVFKFASTRAAVSVAESSSSTVVANWARTVLWRASVSVSVLSSAPGARDPGEFDRRGSLSGFERSARCALGLVLRSLTFELRRDQQQNARPVRWKMRQPTARAWRFDVGPRLERGVRQHCSRSMRWLRPWQRQVAC